MGGIRILQPFVARGRAREWYRGTADAVATNVDAIHQSGADIVVILAGDHIYKMDYGPFIQQHRRRRADVTIAVKPVPLAEAHRFGVLTLDDNDAVTDWQEKPRQPRSDLASLGIYVFSRKALDTWLGGGRDDFGKDIIPAMLEAGARVYGYRFDGYWQDVGTVHSYWEAQMELLEDHPALDLFGRDWVIHTRSEERPPARIGSTANVHRSLISHGCVISGTVEHSVLSPGVQGRPWRHRARQRHHVRLRHPRRSGGRPRHPGQGGERRTQRRDRHGHRLRHAQRGRAGAPHTGITVVGKRAVIPASARIGRNVRIAGSVRPSDFRSKRVPSGGSIERAYPQAQVPQGLTRPRPVPPVDAATVEGWLAELDLRAPRARRA